MKLRKREWRRGTTMTPKLVQLKVRMRRRMDIVQIWTSGRCPVGDGQKMYGRRATKDTALRESEEEECSNERDRAGKRRKLGKKRDDGIGGVEVCPAKTTRLSTRGRKEKKKR